MMRLNSCGRNYNHNMNYKRAWNPVDRLQRVWWTLHRVRVSRMISWLCLIVWLMLNDERVGNLMVVTSLMSFYVYICMYCIASLLRYRYISALTAGHWLFFASVLMKVLIQSIQVDSSQWVPASTSGHWSILAIDLFSVPFISVSVMEVAQCMDS